MICPVDHELLKVVNAKDNTVNACMKCGGVWFDYSELQATVKNFVNGEWEQSYNFNVVGKNLISEESKKWKETKELLCPKDGVIMTEYVYAGDSHIRINECKTCGGFWLDGDELNQIWEYLKPNKHVETLGKAWIMLMQDADRMRKEFKDFEADLVMLAQQPTPLGLVFFLAQVLKRHIAEKVRQGRNGQF